MCASLSKGEELLKAIINTRRASFKWGAHGAPVKKKILTFEHSLEMGPPPTNMINNDQKSVHANRPTVSAAKAHAITRQKSASSVITLRRVSLSILFC
jgi:hypothetical protein